MKRIISAILALSVMASALTACSPNNSGDGSEFISTGITLSDDGVLVGGEPASTDASAAVYVANDIIFYLEGQGSEYGEGEAREEHSQAEADRHTVVHITQPGNYHITGSLSCGQIAVDLGEDAKDNPDAVVNITLSDVNLTCTVAPAIVCYSAYECGSDDTETATKDVDTSAAGFNLYLADGTENNISGSHVARIYKPGTTDKLHKYDAAIESMVSMNINGTDGILNLTSDNEGIETKLHMTINGGEININSTDDSLNAGEDGVSVITINGGKILANANNGLEGDGIDSNGWLIINGGTVSAFSSEKSMDSGLDSDNGIYINGGIVYATGCMYDRVSSDSAQTAAVFTLDEWVYNEEYVLLKSSAGDAVAAFKSTADHKVMIYSSPLLTKDEYTLYKAKSVTGESHNGIYTLVETAEGETQLGHSTRGSNFAMQRPQGEIPFEKGDMPQGAMEIPDDKQGKGGRPFMNENGDMPQLPEDFEKITPPDGEMPQLPENFEGKMPQGEKAFGRWSNSDDEKAALSDTFKIMTGVNLFNCIRTFEG